MADTLNPIAAIPVQITRFNNLSSTNLPSTLSNSNNNLTGTGDGGRSNENNTMLEP